MDESKPENLKLAPPSLKAAMRRARAESAEKGEAKADLRQAELIRLELLEEALRPVVDQAPEDVEFFDVGIAHGERPRLFLDMIAFVDLAHDRHTYRFFQDTRHGRVLIAESESIDRMVSAITNYVARRMVEREQALASDWRSRHTPAAEIEISARSRKIAEQTRYATGEDPAPATTKPAKRGVRKALAAASDVFGFLLMTLGSITLCALLFVAIWVGWEALGRGIWRAHFGAPPF